MKKTVIFIKSKLALIGVVLVSIMAGSITTAVVSASIPDSGGTIHGCYRNTASLFDSKGTLRTVNTDDGETCTSQETALNWSQNPGGPIAYGHISYDLDTNTFTLDNTHSHNITSVFSDPNFPALACLHINGTLKSVAATSSLAGSNAMLADIKDGAGNWIGAPNSAIAQLCSQDDPTANAGLLGSTGGTSYETFLQIF